jgi:O-antigen/teichoic acid export membrane protein
MRGSPLPGLPQRLLGLLTTAGSRGTAEGRGRERYRRLALSVLASVGLRGVTTVITLASVPLALGYLGAERYGLWMTIASVTALMAFADLGLGNGLMNLVSEAHGRDDRDAARRSVSSAFFALAGLAIVLALAFAIAYPFVPWADLLNVSSSEAASEAGPAIAVFFACFALGLPLGVVARIQLGYQEGFVTSAWAAVGAVAGLAGLGLAVIVGAGLPWLVLAVAGGPVLAWALNGVHLLRSRRWLLPSARLVSRRTGSRLVRLGFLFCILQLAASVAYTSDVVVAAQVVGPAAAATYSVTLRLFMVTPLLVWSLIMPAWPAYSEALTVGDLRWVRRTLVGSVLSAAAITAFVSLGLVLLAPAVLERWLGAGEIDPPLSLLAGAALWATLHAAYNAAVLVLNAANAIRLQVLVAIVTSVVSLGASVVLGRAFGLSGIIWGTFLAHVVCAAIPIALYLPRFLAGLEQNRAHSPAAPAEA